MPIYTSMPQMVHEYKHQEGTDPLSKKITLYEIPMQSQLRDPPF